MTVKYYISDDFPELARKVEDNPFPELYESNKWNTIETGLGTQLFLYTYGYREISENEAFAELL